MNLCQVNPPVHKKRKAPNCMVKSAPRNSYSVKQVLGALIFLLDKINFYLTLRQQNTLLERITIGIITKEGYNFILQTLVNTRLALALFLA